MFGIIFKTGQIFLNLQKIIQSPIVDYSNSIWMCKSEFFPQKKLTFLVIHLVHQSILLLFRGFALFNQFFCKIHMSTSTKRSEERCCVARVFLTKKLQVFVEQVLTPLATEGALYNVTCYFKKPVKSNVEGKGLRGSHSMEVFCIMLDYKF